MKAWFWAAQRSDFLYVLRSLSVLGWGGGVFCAGLVRVCRACMIPLFFSGCSVFLQLGSCMGIVSDRMGEEVVIQGGYQALFNVHTCSYLSFCESVLNTLCVSYVCRMVK